MQLTSRLQRGVTLIELIISIVIISVALSGILVVMNLTVSHSADPIIYHQSLAVAEACLEDILLKPYAELTDCNTLSLPTGYSVSSVIASPADFSSVMAKKITVTVTAPADTHLDLIGYRVDYGY